MLLKILRSLKSREIDVLVFSKSIITDELFPSFLQIQSSALTNNKIKYFVAEGDVEVHKSILFPKIHILSLIGKKGPAIGDCSTLISHRGRSLYPIVINHIANEQLNLGVSEVFMIVNTDNVSSIKGITKAGFQRIAMIKATRFLLFYFKKDVTYF